MKYLLSLLLFIPAILFAQTSDTTRYGAGAIPEIDGKVVFSKEFDTPKLTQDQIFDIMLKWANEYFAKEKDKKTNKVVFSDKAAGDIAAIGERYLVFANKSFALDHALTKYKIIIECRGSKCTVKMINIKYTYEVNYQREPMQYTAEEWITDESVLTRNGGLNRVNRKFRIATIDYADDIFKSAGEYLEKSAK